MSGNRLAQLFAAHEGKGVDKWEQYFWIYEAELAPFIAQGKPISLLEIGVQNGGSLELWTKYLPEGSTIVGLDIDPRVGELRFEGPITTHIADVNDSGRVASALGDATFDVIIDDGSHLSSHVKTAFRTLFDRVRPGGLFVAEDMHASYWASHEGGLRLRSSAVEYFKDLVDALSADHFQSTASLTKAELEELRALAPWMGRVSFYDSVIVVQKLKARKAHPYRRLLSGSRFDVVDPFSGIDIGAVAAASGEDADTLKQEIIARVIFELKTRAGLDVPSLATPQGSAADSDTRHAQLEMVQRELGRLAGQDATADEVRAAASAQKPAGAMARLARRGTRLFKRNP